MTMIPMIPMTTGRSADNEFGFSGAIDFDRKEIKV